MKDQHSSWDIRLEHLRVGYGSRVVLDDINAVLPGGKITVILGESGCGKSTLLRHVIGLSPVSYTHLDVYKRQEGIVPVLAVKLQEMFGMQESPAIAEGKVPVLVHLLSPAGRPLQITRDLKGFWKNGYPAVRAEMRGRYPKPVSYTHLRPRPGFPE